MMKLPSGAAERILRSNADVHRAEAVMYDAVHPEIFGSYEQRQTNRDLDMIASRLPAGRPIHAMDVGCGTGNITLKYLERGYEVRAVDLSPEMLERLRSKIPEKARSRLDIVEGDAQKAVDDPRTWGFYDIVSFSSVLHHLPDYMTVLSHALQQLRPDGFLWVCHEPLAIGTGGSKAPATLAGFVIGRADNLYILVRKAFVYAWLAVNGRRRPERIDYSWSDYHARAGIAAPLVLKAIENDGASIVFYEAYNSRFSSLLAHCDQCLNVLPHANFRFIAQARR